MFTDLLATMGQLLKLQRINNRELSKFNRRDAEPTVAAE